MLMLNVPATVGLMVLAAPIVRMLLRATASSRRRDTLATAAALQFYAIGLVGYSVVRIASPMFYALGRNRTPVIVSIVDGAGERGAELRAGARRSAIAGWRSARRSPRSSTPTTLLILLRTHLQGSNERAVCSARSHGSPSRRRRWASPPCASYATLGTWLPGRDRRSSRSSGLAPSIGVALVVLAGRRVAAPHPRVHAGRRDRRRAGCGDRRDDARPAVRGDRSGSTAPSCSWRARTSSSTATATSSRRCCRCSSPISISRWPPPARCRCASSWPTRCRSLAFGHLADRWRPRVLLIAGPLVARLVLTLIGLAPNVWRARGSCSFSAVSAARRFIRRPRRSSTSMPGASSGLAMSFHITSGTLGQAVAPLAFAPVRPALRPESDAAAHGAGAARASPCCCAGCRPIERLQERHDAGGLRALRPYARPLSLLYFIVVLRTLTAIVLLDLRPGDAHTARPDAGAGGNRRRRSISSPSDSAASSAGRRPTASAPRRVIILSLVSAVPFLALAPLAVGLAVRRGARDRRVPAAVHAAGERHLRPDASRQSAPRPSRR